MNQEERQRRWHIGCTFLEEAIYDVLKESCNSNEPGIIPVEICARMGLPSDGGPYEITLYILSQMEAQGKVNSRPVGGPRKLWSLPSE